MKTLQRWIAACALGLVPAAALAANVPLPVENATLNVSLQVQSQALYNENGAPNGTDPSLDLFVRRTRLLVNGDFANSFSYTFQVDNTNFGKFGNYTGRMVVQDAWFGWAPTGIKGGTVVYIDAGIIFYPTSREIITSTTNKPTAEGHPDINARGISAAGFNASRSTGIDIRGWALDKKVGFRGGVFEGVQPIGTSGLAATTIPASQCVVAATTGATTTAPSCLNPNKRPALAGFVNLDLIGSEEGGWLYQNMYFGKDPILSLSFAGTYQSQALAVGLGLVDQSSLNSTLFLDYPLSTDQEVVVTLAGYLYGNGAGSKDTGQGMTADLRFRHQWISPYVSYEYFNANDCSTDLSASALKSCKGTGGAHTADSRNFRAGLDFFFNKNLNHLALEFSLNRGQSAWGAQSVASPAPAAGTGNPPLASLGRSPSKSLLAHWNVNF